MGAPLMMAAAPGEASRGLRLEERAPSITTLIVDALKASMTTSSGPVCTGPTEAPSVVPAMPAGAVPAKFSGFAPETDAPRPPASPFASAATADVQASAERSHADPIHNTCVPAPRPASNAGAAPRNYSSNSLPGSWSQHDDGHDRSSNIDGLSLPLSAHTLLPQPLAPLAALTQQRLHALLPSVVARVMPELLPALLPSALEAAIASASAVTSTDGPDAASVPAMLEAAVPAALAAVLPKALTATLASLIHYATAGASSPSTFSGEAAAVLGGERQTSLDQQGAAELQLVRLLFGAEGGDVAQQQEAQRVISQGAPKALNLAELPAAPSSVHSGDSPVGAGAASAAGSGPHSPVNQPASRSSSGTAAAAAAAAAHQPAAAHLSPLSPAGAAARCLAPPPANGQSNHHNHHAQPHASASFHARASHHSHSHLGGQHLLGGEDAMSSVEDALSTCSNDATPSPYGEHGGGGSNGGTGAAVNSSANSFLMDSQALSANSVTGTLAPGLTGVDPLGIGADSAADMAAAAAAGMYGFNRDALYDRLQQLQGQPGAGGAATPAELLMAAASGRAMAAGGGGQGQQAAAAAAQLYAAQQAQHAQQHAQQQAQQAQQLQQLQQLQALVAGRQSGCLLPTGGLSEDLGPTSPNTGPGMPTWRRTSGTTGAELGLGHWTLGSSEADAVNLAAASLALNQQQQAQAQAAAAGLLHQQQAQAQAQQQQYLAQSLAAVAAANAAGAFNGAGGLQLAAAAAGLGGAAGLPANVAADLATYMDAALRRMLLVSPQVAAELARACGAFSGAHAQLHHLCCVIAEQLLDVAAMAPEVAAALLRALAAHRARGAQATDVDPRVMGRILQLLRAGPAGRQLCLVSLEQWVDGLSRIHKRRAYLDTILHNYQLTLKRLVQAMGHQVHAVNMALPRQLLNDLSPRALLLLTAELAPYPLLQPRRWSEEIIWTVSQMHSMGVDMPLSNPAAAAAATAPGVQPPTTAFQWEIRRALAATAEDIAAAGGAGCGQSPPGAGGSGPLAGLTGQLGGLGLACGAAGASGSSGSTTPGGAAVPWAAHAALHRHLLMGLRRIQARFFQERLRKVHGLFGDAVDALLRQSLPQDVLVPEREVVVLVLVLLMLECRMRPEDFDSAFGRDLQRCLAVSTVDEVAARLRCGLVPDSALRIDPHKSRALSQLLKLGPLPGQASVF